MLILDKKLLQPHVHATSAQFISIFWVNQPWNSNQFDQSYQYIIEHAFSQKRKRSYLQNMEFFTSLTLAKTVSTPTKGRVQKRLIASVSFY